MFIYVLRIKWGLSFIVKTFLYPVIRYGKGLYLCPQFFYFFFLILRSTPIPVPWWMPSNGSELFFYWDFFSLTFLIAFAPSNKPIIIAIVIVIMPYFHLLIVTNQSGTYFNNHRHFLKRGKKRGSMSTSLALMQIRIKYIPYDTQNNKVYDIQNDPQIYVHLFTDIFFVW